MLNKETGQLVTAFELINELKRIQRLGEFNSAEKSKLRTGFLLGHIVEQFDRMSNGEVLPKLTLYSSHDATLTSLLYSLNASNELLVPYAAAISFEFYVDGPHMPAYYIKVSLNNPNEWVIFIYFRFFIETKPVMIGHMNYNCTVAKDPLANLANLNRCWKVPCSNGKRNNVRNARNRLISQIKWSLCTIKSINK